MRLDFFILYNVLSVKILDFSLMLCVCSTYGPHQPTQKRTIVRTYTKYLPHIIGRLSFFDYKWCEIILLFILQGNICYVFASYQIFGLFLLKQKKSINSTPKKRRENCLAFHFLLQFLLPAYHLHTQ